MQEEWKSIEYDIRYQVSNFGRFRKKLKTSYRYLKPFKKKGTLLYLVKIRNKNFNCARLVANYHIQKLTDNDRVYHKNHMNSDNYFRNLKIVSLEELGKLTGYKSKSKSVVQVKNREVIKRWNSARKCAKDLFISYQTAMDYCNNKVNKPMFNLMWEENYYDD